jgi:hypothetical protein
MARLRRNRAASFRPSVELLERRWVPTTITPMTFADVLGSGSLRDAVLQFNVDTGTDDDIIQLQAGTYHLTIPNAGGQHETAGLTGDLNVTQTRHRWIIQGAGPSTIIDASQLQDRVFQIVNPGTQVVFQDLVIQGGLAQDDGSDGSLAGTTDALGGGILNNGGDLTLDNVILQNNVARGGHGHSAGHENAGYNARGGGLYSTGGTLTISGSTLANNQATGGMGGIGGAFFAIPGPGGDAQGGGLYASGGALTISQNTLAENGTTGGDGHTAGGYDFGGAGGNAQGAGLYATGSLLTVADSTVANNALRGGDGGASRVSHGYNLGGGDGGTGQGGGIYARGGMLTICNATVAGNTLRGGDGGNTDSPYTPGGNGGAGQGSGLWVDAGATVQLSFSNIATNQATGGTHGSGPFSNGNDGSATGGGLYTEGTLQTDSTVLAGNVVNGPGTNSGPDLAGNLGSLGYNLIGNSQGGSGFDPSDLLDVGPLLGPLQDNGGPTQTMALLPGSPALNAGDPGQLGVPDQRGVSRSGGVNIGAYQASASTFLVSAPDTVQAGLPFDVTVTAVDPYNQVAVGYTGTVTFTTSDPDPGVVLPADYTFTLDDAGVHTFADSGLGETTLITPGDQTLTVMDTADNTITGSATITVNAGPVPAPHGQGPPPGMLQPSPLQGDAWTRSEPPPNEVVAADEWFASFQPTDQGRATFMVTLNTQGPVHLTVTDTADNTVFAALDLIVL